MSAFDDALQKRFDEAPLITAIEVTSNDTLLIRDLETGQVMRIPVSVFYSALGSAFASLVDGKANAALQSNIAPTLLNSWVNYLDNWGECAYYKDSFGIVHLTGLVKNGNLGQAVFNLPIGYRPEKNLFFPTTSNNSFGTCIVQPNSDVIAQNGSNAYYSLDGVTFRAS